MKFLKTFCVAMALIGYVTTAALSFEVPELQGHRVNDYAGLMTPADREDLANTLRALEEKTTAQVAILTVKDLQGEDMKSFKHTVFTTWKLGQKNKDNGLLIVYSVDDHYGIEVGYGLEGAIPDSVAGDIIRHKLRAKADPKKGLRDFHGAFADAVATISERILAESEVKATTGDRPPLWAVFLIVVGVIVVVIIVVAMIAGSQSSPEPAPVHYSSRSSRSGRSSRTSSSSRSSRRRDDDDSSLLGVAVGSSLGSSSSSGSDWGSGSSDSGFSGGGGDSGGGGASD